MKQLLTALPVLSLVACSTTVETPHEPVKPPPLVVPAEFEPPPPAAEPSALPAFHEVVRGQTRVLLHPLRSGELFVSVGPLVMAVDDEGEIVRDPTWYRGIRGVRSPEPEAFMGLEMWDALVVDGTADGLYMSLDLASGFRSESADPVLYRRTPTAWVAQSTESKYFNWYPREIRRAGERIVARRVFEPRYPGHDFERDGEPSERAVARAQQEIARANPLVVLDGPKEVPRFSLDRIDAFDALPSGDLFAVQGSEKPRLERRSAGGSETTFDIAIPAGHTIENPSLVALAPDDVFVHGALVDGEGARAPLLAHCDGERCTVLQGPPCKEGLGSFVRTKRDRWVTCATNIASWYVGEDDSLWRSRGGGAWTRIPIEGAARQVVARGEDIYVAVQSSDFAGVLLRTRPASRVLETPTIAELGYELFEWGDPLPVSKHCSFALIPVSPSSNATADIAALESAFAGLVFRNSVVLEEGTLAEKPTWFLRFGFVHDREQVPEIERRARKALGERVGSARCLSKEGTGELKVWEMVEE